MTLAFLSHHRVVRAAATSSVVRYRADAHAEPLNLSLEINGPGDGISCVRQGGHDFSSFVRLARSVVEPGMSDEQKAMAVYRFAAENFHGFGMGWGNTEMTRFINAFGYSFCWGQADFQHLLYEAAGLRARAPALVGHSSVEVLLDGRWRLFDAFMRLVAPAPRLDGLATGGDMAADPARWEAIRVGEVCKNAKSFWSKHGPSSTYDPLQDARAMTIVLRRGEAIRFEYRPRGLWCMAPYEPDDYVNGRWLWTPPLDAAHILRDACASENVEAGPQGIKPIDFSRLSMVEHRIHCPYPLVVGSASLRFSGAADVAVSVSIDAGRTWIPLHRGAAGEVAIPLDAHLTARKLGPSPDAWQNRHLIRHTLHLRIAWTGPASLDRAAYDLTFQAHGPSLPRVVRGFNAWSLIGGEGDATATHKWEEFPEISLSADRPFEGQKVTCTARVHNRGTSSADGVRVAFVEVETGTTLGETVLERIAPGASAEASVTWPAAVTVQMRAEEPLTHRPYARTTVEARIIHPAAANVVAAESQSGRGDAELWQPVARAVMVVRPRPRPHFGDALVWVGEPDRERETLTLRAAVAHQQSDDARPMLYLVPASMRVRLRPYLGHPDHGGLRLAPERALDVRASEFGIAEWDIPLHALPKEFELWVEAVCEPPVASGNPQGERLLGRRAIKLD